MQKEYRLTTSIYFAQADPRPNPARPAATTFAYQLKMESRNEHADFFDSRSIQSTSRNPLRGSRLFPLSPSSSSPPMAPSTPRSRPSSAAPWATSPGPSAGIASSTSLGRPSTRSNCARRTKPSGASWTAATPTRISSARARGCKRSSSSSRPFRIPRSTS